MDAPFAPRDGAGALTFHGKMWLIGGWNTLEKDRSFFPRVCANDVWSSVDGRSWTLEKPGTFGDPSFDPDQDWEGRHTAGYGVYQDRMWIVGGDANQGHYQSDIWNSDDGRTWTRVSRGQNPPWMPRVLHHTVVFRDAIWVMGGQTMPDYVRDGAPEAFFNDIWRSRDGVEWERIEVEGHRWAPRGMIGGAAVLDGRMWILGGGTYDTPTTPTRSYYNDVWSTADGVHWTCHARSAPWPARSYHDVAVFDNRLWVVGGHYPGAGDSARNHADVWHSADGILWDEVPDTPWAPRHAASLFVHADALWVVAGNNMESDVWRLAKL